MNHLRSQESTAVRGCRVLAAVLLFLAVAGCGTQGPGISRVDIAMAGQGTVNIEGRIVPIDRLPRRLKAAGATTETEIRVAVPRQTPTAELKFVTSRLRRAGFGRIIFATPKQAQVWSGR